MERRSTHLKRLNGVEVESVYFIDVERNLGERLGAGLFQMPPNLKKDMGDSRIFSELISPDISAVMEFRSGSWFGDGVFDCLRSKGIAVFFAHEGDDGDEDVAPRFRLTAGCGYLRLQGSE